MPLSDEEQRMLDEMERQLFAEDPHLARRIRVSESSPRDRRRIVLGLLGVLLGLGLLVLAVALPAIWLGVLAFVLMLVSALAAIGPRSTANGGGLAEGGDARRGPAPDRPGQPDLPSDGRARSDFMRRLEERWERRSGGGSSF